VSAIVFFISGHGFGHASRQVEVINEVGQLRPDLRLIIRSAVSAPLLHRTLRVPYDLRPGACDVGIIQRTSVEHDDEATVREAIAFYASFDERIAAEAQALRGEDIVLVVGDIPPVAFEVAAALSVPSIAISNFTWDWIYETHPGMTEAAPWLVPRLRQSYGRATRALELPFAGGFEIFRHSERVPLIARRPTRTRTDTRAAFRVPPDRPAVLLSFGGYGLPALDVTQVDCRDWTLVLTDRITSFERSSIPEHVVFVPETSFQDSGFRYEDLVAAVDVVLSKPGYGIVSECIACDTPLLYTSRGEFREYDLFVREMPRYLRCRFIDHADLFAGRWRPALEHLLAQPPAPESMATDGATVVAKELSNVVRN
jgi:L-arabinokinase